jgi:hypothetical protein
MSDPNSIDDLTKVAGGSGVAGIVAAIWAFLARSQTSSRLDTMAAQIGALTQAVADLSAKLTVLMAASERRDNEHERLNAESRFAHLEARMEAVEKLLERTVHQ